MHGELTNKLTSSVLNGSLQDVPNPKGFNAKQPGSDATQRIFDFMALVEFSGCPPSSRIKLPVRGRGVAALLKAEPMVRAG